MTDFVLVHGAWHGGWCWRRVTDILTAHGHRVFTPTLTGLADRSHLLTPAVNLTTHITDVTNLIKWEDLDGFVLCGHSYGGMVITGVAERIGDRIGAIVYVDAFLPGDGQSNLDLLNGELPDMPVVPPPPTSIFHMEGPDAAWVESKMTPQPGLTNSEKLRVTGAYQRIPSKTYILAAKFDPYPTLAAIHDRLGEDPSWNVLKMATGHEVMIEDPVGLAAILQNSL